MRLSVMMTTTQQHTCDDLIASGHEFNSWPPRVVLTGIGDCLLVGKPPQYFTMPPRGQLNLLASVGQEMSTSRNVVILDGRGVKANVNWFTAK